MHEAEIAVMKHWNARHFMLIIFGVAVPSQAISAAAIGTICNVPFGAHTFVFESNGKGADRLNISPTSYILRYNNRVYLSKLERSKTGVFDLTAHANSRLAVAASFDELGLLPLIDEYAELARKLSDDSEHSGREQNVTPAKCAVRIISPERFSLLEIPVAVPLPSY